MTLEADCLQVYFQLELNIYVDGQKQEILTRMDIITEVFKDKAGPYNIQDHSH